MTQQPYKYNAQHTEQNDEIRSSIELITPEIAQTYIDNQRTNRKIRQAHVSRLVDDMVNGRWQSMSDPIKFDDKNRLIDGQHRLSAVIKSKIPQKFIVLRGYNTESMLLLDTGLKRNTANIGQVRGLDIDNSDCATVNHLSLPLQQDKLSELRQLEIFESYYDGIKFIGNLTSRVRGGTSKDAGYIYPNAPLRALLAKAFYYENHQDLSAFVNGFMTGMPDSLGREEITPSIALRNYVIALKNSRGYSMTFGAITPFYLICQLSLHHFIKRNPITRIQKTSKCFDNYPLPGIQSHSPEHLRRFKYLNSSCPSHLIP